MGPLKGIKVLDLTSMVSGPVGAMILADQGADVIKVEPITGELVRHMAAPHRGVNPVFFSCNRVFVHCTNDITKLSFSLFSKKKIKNRRLHCHWKISNLINYKT